MPASAANGMLTTTTNRLPTNTSGIASSEKAPTTSDPTTRNPALTAHSQNRPQRRQQSPAASREPPRPPRLGGTRSPRDQAREHARDRRTEAATDHEHGHRQHHQTGAGVSTVEREQRPRDHGERRDDGQDAGGGQVADECHRGFAAEVASDRALRPRVEHDPARRDRALDNFSPIPVGDPADAGQGAADRGQRPQTWGPSPRWSRHGRRRLRHPIDAVQAGRTTATAISARSIATPNTSRGCQ